MNTRTFKSALILLVFLSTVFPGSIVSQNSAAQTLSLASPELVGMSSEKLRQIETVVQESIAKGELPGAIVLVGRQGRIVYQKAIGNRSVQPARVPMTLDTVFDLASLTKVVATATSIMTLIERGKVRLWDPVARYLPEFAQNGKARITVEQLLTHRAGLIADNDLADYQAGAEQAMKNVYALSTVAEPGTRFIYSDVGYIVLAEIVRRVSGKRIDEFARENIFKPLGMNETAFLPQGGLRARAAPTEQREGRWMVGEVHDPRSYALGGVAGHAGLFSTASDLARYCQMILNGGALGRARILSPMSVRRMTEARGLPPGELRGLGWDINTGYSSNRGDLFPIGSFGHTGFTGTSMWIDPSSQTFVVFLSNRVHPDGKGDVTPLRGRVASIVAASIMKPPLPENRTIELAVTMPAVSVPASSQPQPVGAGKVLTGIDVLRRDGFRQLEGRSVGLITNHTGRSSDGQSTIDLLFGAKNLKLVALFSPEHGIRGKLDEAVGDTVDEKTGLPIYSLYGQRRRPTADTLKGIDTLVFDIQDIGARFYTYITTLGYAMEEAARHGIRLVVLDRPNPINGVAVEGPLADREVLSFTAYHPIPVRHGMTVGELAELYNGERKIGAELQVIKMEGWRRSAWFDGTGLEWINPSPNMRSLNAAALYPGLCLMEATNLSMGRGTDKPFEMIGAPWLDGRRLAEELNRRNLPGVRFIPVRFTPQSSKFANEECGGVHLIITDRTALKSVSVGIEIAVALRRLYPEAWKVDDVGRLLANRAALDMVKRGDAPDAIIRAWEDQLNQFKQIRQKYLLYR